MVIDASVMAIASQRTLHLRRIRDDRLRHLAAAVHLTWYGGHHRDR